MKKTLIDTNVLLDVIANREPHVSASKKIWELSEVNEIEGVISAISFNNIYYIVRKIGGRELAHKALENLRGIFSTATVDEKIMNQAIDSEIADFEDAIQYYCGIRYGCRFLITRNPLDFPKKSSLQIVTPELFLGMQVNNEEND